MELDKYKRYPWRAFLDENRTKCGACRDEFILWTPPYEMFVDDYLLCLSCCNKWRESQGYSKWTIEDEDPA